MGAGDFSETIAGGESLEGLIEEAEVGGAMYPPATDVKKWNQMAKRGKDALDEALGVDDTRGFLTTTLIEESLMACLVAAYRFDMQSVSFKLQALAEKPRCRKTVETLTSNIRRAAKEQSKILNDEMRNEQTRKRATTLSKMFGTESIPPGLKCPRGWEITEEGVFSVKNVKGEEETTRVCNAPIFITKRMVEYRCSEAQLELMWRQGDKWTRRICPRKDVYETRALASLAQFDAPTNAVNASDVMRFLSDFEGENMDAIPKEDMASSMGWQDDEYTSFVIGNGTIQKEGSDRHLTIMQKEGFGLFCDGWTDKGDIEMWYAMMRSIESFWAPFACVYISVASILLDILDVPNHMYEYAGETTGGKTLTMRIGASVWGKPEKDTGILSSWDASKVGFGHIASFCGHLPVYCDDTAETARKSPELLAKIIYQHSAGQGGLRGTAANTLQERKKWRCILVSTGETPAHTLTNDAGTRARTVSFVGYPFGRSVGPELEKKKSLLAGVDTMLHENYGLFGPLVVKKIVNTPDFVKEIRATYKHYHQKYREQADGAVLGRIASYVALIATAKDLCEEVGLPEPAVNVMDNIWSAAKKTALEADVAQQALDAFLDFCVSSETRFYGRHREIDGAPVVPTGGWVGAWDKKELCSDNSIYIMDSILGDFLRVRGFFPTAIMDAWIERGWVARAANGRGPAKMNVPISGSSRPCVKFSDKLIDVQG